MNVREYVRKLTEMEQYSFSLEELRRHTDKSGAALKLELARMTEQSDIVNLRKGYYLIIPPRYASFGTLPVGLFVEKLFEHLKRAYYVGLYSAARLHGASHQQIHKDYILTPPPKLIDIKRTNTDIRFFTTSHWPKDNLVKKRSDAGDYQLSSPILTVVDLIYHQSKIGGLNRILPVVEELLEDVTEDEMSALLSWYPYCTSLQRFGFLIDELKARTTLSDMLYEHISKANFYPTLLSPNSNVKPGATGNRWRVDVNVLLDSDL